MLDWINNLIGTEECTHVENRMSSKKIPLRLGWFLFKGAHRRIDVFYYTNIVLVAYFYAKIWDVCQAHNLYMCHGGII